MTSGGKSTANDPVELEAKRKEDSSWHPCQVSLCPSGVGLIVDYGNRDSEDIIVNKEEAFARLRFRSLPLQGDDCSHIHQGELVLATQKAQSKSLFFDAEVEKAQKVRHSKKVHCRCTFMIKWLHEDLNRTLIVPSSSIMKLATKSIDVHPTISIFLNTVRTLICSRPSPVPTVVKDMDCEMDLQELLEKQIKEISNSVDASKKKITEDILLGVEVDTKGQVQCRAVAASKISDVKLQVPPDQNHLKRSTRSRTKQKTEMVVKDPPPPPSSVQEDFPESRSPLTPLAARAALASIMSNLPRNLEFSIFHEEGKGFTYLSDLTTHKQVTTGLNGTDPDSSSVANNSSMMDKLSSKIEAASFLLVPKSDNVEKPQLVDVSSEVLTKEWGNENETLEVTDSSATFTCLTGERKVNQHTKATRLTRAAVQKGAGIPDENIERKTCVEEMELRSATNRRRLTRAAVQKVSGIPDENIERKTCVEEMELRSATNRRRLTRSTVRKEEEFKTSETKKIIEENISAKYAESDSSEQNVTSQENYVLNAKKMVASPLDAEVDLVPADERKNLVKKERSYKKHDIEKKTCAAEIKNSNNTRRLTRSAVHLETGNRTMEAIQGLDVNKYSECVKSDLSGGNVTVVESNVLETKKPISSPLHAEISLSPTDERNKKRKMSGTVKTTQKTNGNVGGTNGCSQGLKRKLTSLGKQELRSSPRLRFLPRTRSQKN